MKHHSGGMSVDTTRLQTMDTVAEIAKTIKITHSYGLNWFSPESFTFQHSSENPKKTWSDEYPETWH